MDEFDQRSAKIYSQNLLHTVAACRAILDIEDTKWKSWIFDSEEYLQSIQNLALDPLTFLKKDLSSLPQLYQRVSNILFETPKLDDQSSRMPSCLYAGYVTHLQIQQEALTGPMEFESAPIEISESVLNEIVNKLYWISKPEVVYSSNVAEMAYHGICRCRMRARDVLNRLSITLPTYHFLHKASLVGLVQEKHLEPVEDLRRDWPGNDSEDFVLRF